MKLHPYFDCADMSQPKDLPTAAHSSHISYFLLSHAARLLEIKPSESGPVRQNPSGCHSTSVTLPEGTQKKPELLKQTSDPSENC